MTAGVPAYQRRAPLRPLTRETASRRSGRVLPPINGGLHCGVRVPEARGTRCSRLSTAGSIAATVEPPLRRRRRVFPPINGGLHCGASVIGLPPSPGVPAYQRRAPLRQGTRTVLTARMVFPPINGGLHCGRHFAFASNASSVFPPINGGLHCGDVGVVRRERLIPVFPPINGGLHCGKRNAMDVRPGVDGVPAYQRRAPLRPGHAGNPGLGLVRVFPPINGGLHCGFGCRAEPGSFTPVFPPINGGLHCGRDSRITWLDVGLGDDERSLLDRAIAVVGARLSQSERAPGASC